MADAPNHERLDHFLSRISKDLGALEMWHKESPHPGNADAVLKKEGGRLRDDHYKALQSGDLDTIRQALMNEPSAGGEDVEGHQGPHFGPCWILVG